MVHQWPWTPSAFFYTLDNVQSALIAQREKLLVNFSQQSLFTVSYIKFIEEGEGRRKRGLLVISEERILFISNFYGASTILHIQPPSADVQEPDGNIGGKGGANLPAGSKLYLQASLRLQPFSRLCRVLQDRRRAPLPRRVFPQ